MLQIQGISKQYKTGDFVQRALDNVSLNLRDSEFVAFSDLPAPAKPHCSTSSADLTTMIPAIW